MDIPCTTSLKSDVEIPNKKHSNVNRSVGRLKHEDEVDEYTLQKSNKI